MKILNSDKEIKEWAEEMPLIPRNEIRILFDTDRYDGPQAGVVLWKNKRYYFYNYSAKEEIENHQKRIYAIINMTREQLKEEDYRQKLLIKFFGFVGNEYNEDNFPIKRPKEFENVNTILTREQEAELKEKEYYIQKEQVIARWILN